MIVDPDLGITLADGTRLSAKLWIPESAKTDPVPAILEYLPYRKTDGTAERDHGMHPGFAKHGYACLRVDRRGCGDSEGLFDDEYSEQELSDGVEIINWIAAQPWCDGNIGMQGISWGGFNGVQIAALAPEPLKAVISIGTTVDRYADDIHYKGGVQLGENIGWAATVMSWFSMPPDPELVGAKWRDMWLDRLKNTPFLASRWIHHADRDEYWKHGSICEAYADIGAPVLVMGGQHDGYRNAMAAMVENLKIPVKGVMGPWSHKYPHISTVEPSIDYLGVALRWWDRWLKGVENDAENDPAYRAYVMDSAQPDPALNYRSGQWVAERDWPSAKVRTGILDLGNGVLGQNQAFSAQIETDIACGRASGEFFPFGFGPGELPDDQRPDDALSCCFDGAPLEADCVILGAPKVRLRVASDKPRAQLVARLCDMRPDGSVALICLGMLNLRHRSGFDEKHDLEPGNAYDVSLAMDQAAYRLPKGHRLRLAVSGSYWPYCWPESENFTLTLSSGALELPIHAGNEPQEWAFDPPPPTAPREYRILREGAERKNWSDDPETGQIKLEIFGDHGRREDCVTGLVTDSTVSERWVIARGNPASARVEIVWTRAFGRGDWEVSSRVETRMWADQDSFVVEQTLQAWEGSERLFEKAWKEAVPR